MKEASRKEHIAFASVCMKCLGRENPQTESTAVVVRVIMLREAGHLKALPRVPSDRSRRRTVHRRTITGVSSPQNWDPEMRSGLHDDPHTSTGAEGAEGEKGAERGLLITNFPFRPLRPF